jgi:hypothetical protein
MHITDFHLFSSRQETIEHVEQRVDNNKDEDERREAGISESTKEAQQFASSRSF